MIVLKAPPSVKMKYARVNLCVCRGLAASAAEAEAAAAAEAEAEADARDSEKPVSTGQFLALEPQRQYAVGDIQGAPSLLHVVGRAVIPRSN